MNYKHKFALRNKTVLKQTNKGTFIIYRGVGTEEKLIGEKKFSDIKGLGKSSSMQFQGWVNKNFPIT